MMRTWPDVDAVAHIGVIVPAVQLDSVFAFPGDVGGYVKAVGVDAAFIQGKSVIVDLIGVVERAAVCDVHGERAVLIGDLTAPAVHISHKASRAAVLKIDRDLNVAVFYFSLCVRGVKGRGGKDRRKDTGGSHKDPFTPLFFHRLLLCYQPSGISTTSAILVRQVSISSAIASTICPMISSFLSVSRLE